MVTLEQLMADRANYKDELLTFVHDNNCLDLDLVSNLYLASLKMTDTINNVYRRSEPSGRFYTFNMTMQLSKELLQAWACQEELFHLEEVANEYFDFSNARYKVSSDLVKDKLAGNPAQGLIYLMLNSLIPTERECSGIIANIKYQHMNNDEIIQIIINSGIIQRLDALSSPFKIGSENLFASIQASMPNTPGMPLTVTANGSAMLYVKVPSKGDIDKINAAFDCYQNAALPDETILDCSTIEEDDDLHEMAIDIFGKAQFDKIAGSMVLFHP